MSGLLPPHWAVLAVLFVAIGGDAAAQEVSTGAPASGPASATPSSVGGAPLVVTGQRSHRPTWRGPRGKPLKAPPESWGKAGVSLADYRRDAAECARQGHDLDISKTKEVDALARISRQMDSMNDQADMASDPIQAYGDIARARQAANYDAKKDRLEGMMQAAVDYCLSGLGYRKFRLTEAQRDQLSKLPFGSDARRAYLFGLASNPQVIAVQGE